MKLDWKVTLIIMVSLLCVVAVICVALANGHDGVMALTAISGFFGLAMYLAGHRGGKKKVEKTMVQNKEDNSAVPK